MHEMRGMLALLLHFNRMETALFSSGLTLVISAKSKLIATSHGGY